MLRGAGWALGGIGTAGALTLCRAPLAAVRDHLASGAPVGAMPFPLLLTGVSAAVLAGSVLWLLLVTAATVLEALTGRTWPAVRALSPRAVRRLVLAGCGIAVSAAVVSPAGAADGDLAGLPLPDRTDGMLARPVDAEARSGLASGPASTPEEALTHRVRSGDSLWSIAQAHLPVGASDDAVDDAWRGLYRSNRGVVGSDPDLIVPGTALRLPTRLTNHTAHHTAHHTGSTPTSGATHDGKDA